MEKRYREFSKSVASAYLLLISAGMPLYMKNGFSLIGNAKYLFYCNASIILLTLWFAGTLVVAIIKKHIYDKEFAKTGFRFFPTDIFAIAFAVCSCLSYLFSDYLGN